MQHLFPLALCGALLITACGEAPYRIEEARAAGPAEPPLVLLIDEDNGIEAAIAPSEGGELSGLRVRFKGEWIETLHRARDYTPRDGWRGKAPVLFPAAGRSAPGNKLPDAGVPEHAYLWEGKQYHMPFHGFVQSRPWSVESQELNESGAGLTLAVSDTPETRGNYPFGFRLQVRYSLSNGKLTLAYTVSAAAGNTANMPFSIGNHITFRAPLLEGSGLQEMIFESPSSIEHMKVSGLPTGESRPMTYADGVPLTEIPDRSAVSLSGYDGVPYMVLRDPQGLAIRMSHSSSSVPPEPVVLFNVWADLGSGLFSPEPWVALQNSLNLKQGLVHLPPGEDWTWTVEISPETAPEG